MAGDKEEEEEEEEEEGEGVRTQSSARRQEQARQARLLSNLKVGPELYSMLKPAKCQGCWVGFTICSAIFATHECPYATSVSLCE